MCIAIYSPIGTKIPCEEYLRNSWMNNPDGGGFAFNLDGNVIIRKGFMHLKDLMTALEDANAKYGLTNRGVLIHTRIATHGGVNPECCHPFPLVGDIDNMKKLTNKCKYAVIHNGIISLTSGSASKKSGASDTMLFIDKYLSKIATNKDWFKNPANMELVYDLADSKLAILDGSGNIVATPGFTKDDDGNYYSNTSYSYNSYNFYYGSSKSSSYSGGWLDDYDSYETGTYPVQESGKIFRCLMIAGPDDSIALDSGDIITPYDLESSGCCYFTDWTGNVYETLPEYVEANKVDGPVWFLDKGKFLDVDLKTKPFRGSYYIDADNIIEDND